MRLIFLTLVVFNEDKFIDSKERHPSNIKLIFLTLVVINEDKSIDSKERTGFEHITRIS